MSYERMNGINLYISVYSTQLLDMVDNIFQIELFIMLAIQFVMKLNVDRQFAISIIQFHMGITLWNRIYTKCVRRITIIFCSGWVWVYEN